MSAPPPAERFMLNMNEFFKVIRTFLVRCDKMGKAPVTCELFDIGHTIAVNADKDQVIKIFTERTYPHWDKIQMKDNDYLSTVLPNILTDIPNIDKVGALFHTRNDDGSQFITIEDREILWRYLTSLVKISVRYVKEKQFDWYDINGEMKRWNLS
jgi:hypothetical protein